MGLAELLDIASSTLKRLRGSPGQTVNVTGKALGGVSVEAEHYQTGGVFHRPAKNERGIFIPIGAGRRYGVVLGGVNYQVTIAVENGETVIYSTTADGSTVKASIKLDASGNIIHDAIGNIELKGNTKTLVTYEALNTALQGLLTTINSQLSNIAAGATAAVATGGFWLTPLVIGGLTLDLSAAQASSLKTDG